MKTNKRHSLSWQNEYFLFIARPFHIDECRSTAQRVGVKKKKKEGIIVLFDASAAAAAAAIENTVSFHAAICFLAAIWFDSDRNER